MKYRSIYKNHYFCIKVHTNNRNIHTWIKHLLDFDNKQFSSKSLINVDFYLNSANRKKRDAITKFFPRIVCDKTKLLSSSFRNNLAEVTLDYKRGIVKGLIYDLKESHKESILGVVFIQPLRLILACHGLFFLHASMVGKDKDCILISGLQNSGKSRISLILAQNGFDFLADDDCFIKSTKNGSKLFPFRTKAGFNDKVLTKYPEFKNRIIENYRWAGKHRFSLCNMFFNYKPIPTGYTCKLIVFPKYKKDNKIYLKHISKEEALHRLIKENIGAYSIKGYRKLCIEGFWALYSLTDRVNAFELIYNDNMLNEIPIIIQRVLT